MHKIQKLLLTHSKIAILGNANDIKRLLMTTMEADVNIAQKGNAGLHTAALSGNLKSANFINYN